MNCRALVAVALLAALPAPAHAWGYQGHKLVAALARSYTSPKANARIDALLAQDTDTLEPHDMLSAAGWPDTWRNSHKETTEWHFVDLELDRPDMDEACFGHPPSAKPASAGPEKSCLVDRLEAFTAELNDPKTSKEERILALKYVLHFMGDIHQPLHAADHMDRGGNCVRVDMGGPMPTNLHSIWDSRILGGMGESWAIAGELKRSITPAMKRQWERGDPKTWALESFEIAKSTVYNLDAKPGCDADAPPPLAGLPAGYETAAQAVIRTQISRAAVRLAWVLNRAFG